MTLRVTSGGTMSTLPPPTTNSLDASQRARLIKSTRKLESLLGVTPHVLDPDMLLPTIPSRGTSNGQLDLYRSSSAASSASSFEDLSKFPETPVSIPSHLQIPQNVIAKWNSRPKSTYSPRRPLVLRLRTVPSLPAMDEKPREHVSKASTNTVTNAATQIPTPFSLPMPSPPSPLFAPEDDTISPLEQAQDTIRRKRMAKLTRTLGENIPPEFLLPKQQSRSSQQHQRVSSEPSSPTSWLDWSWDEVESPITTTSHTHDSLPSTLSLSHSHPTVKRKHYRKSASLGTPTLFPGILEKRPSTADHSLTPVRRQDGQGSTSDLTGEWSIKDAEKRAMLLRNLRSR